MTALANEIDNHKFGDDLEELAYQLWAFDCGRDAGKVVQRLKEQGCERLPDPQTVRRWARDRSWPAKVRDDLRLIAPDLTEQTVIDLIVGRRKGVRYLNLVMDAAMHPEPELDRQGMARTLDGEPVAIQASFRPNKEAITAAIALLDRGGFSPIGSNADPATRLPAQTSEAAVSLADHDVVDLMALERELRAKHAPPEQKRNRAVLLTR